MTEPYWDPLQLNWELVRNVKQDRYVDFVLIIAASYGNQQVHLTTTNVVKKSSYNQPMDVVAAINWAKNKEKGMWPDVADQEP